MAREKIGELVVELRAETKQLRKELNLMKKRMQGVKKETDKATKGISNFVSTIGITAGVGTALFAVKNFTMEAVKLGFEMEGLENAFNEMAGQSAPELIRQLDKAAAGTVANIDLIAASNRAMLLGIDKEALPEMMEIARAAAQAMGTDVTTAFNDIAKGLGRQSKLILDNLGIIVSIETANKNYAEQLGKSASALTDAEMKQAFLNETLKAGRENIENMGGALDTNKEAVQRLTAQWKEFKTSVGEKFSAQLGGIAMDFFTLMDASNNLSESTETLTNEVSFLSDNLSFLPQQLAFLQTLPWFKENFWDKGIAKLAEYNEQLEIQRNSIADITLEGIQWQQSQDELADGMGVSSDAAQDLALMTEEYQSRVFGLNDDLKRGAITVAEFTLMEIALKKEFEAQLPLINANIKAQKEYTDAINETAASFREYASAAANAFGSGRKLNQVINEIVSGDVEASQAVRDIIGITPDQKIIGDDEKDKGESKQMGGLVQRDSLQFLHQGEQVVPKGQVNGKGGSGGITVNIGTISGLDADAIAEALQEKLTKLITV